MRPKTMVAGLAAMAALAVSVDAGAVVPMINGLGGPRDYGWNCLHPNDDGSSALIDLGPAFASGLHFFSAWHTSAYVNTNGNITFSGALPTYTPNAFPVSSQPMIAPYWADEDIRYHDGFCDGGASTSEPGDGPCLNPAENGVWWFLGTDRMVVTWDRNGYFSCHMDKRMTFQLVLTSATGCASPGDFDVEFRFAQCEWETGDASGGSGGFGGTEAQAGFDAGNMSDYVAIPGSMLPGISSIMCNDSNVGVPGLWQFQIRSGVIVCPDAGLPCETGALGACAQGVTQCVGSGTECVAVVGPTAERCDAIDNDCDGETDEDEGMCTIYEICDAGVCVERCTEFGCPAGQVCREDVGYCVDEECLYVDCPEGQRCEEGVCLGACDGIFCPEGQECRGGGCVDLCDTLTCDTCTVCEDGACVLSCVFEACDPGWTCQPDGTCLEDLCVGVACPEGFFCAAGACVDSCAGAVCPDGEICELGECVPYVPPEVEPEPYPDASTDTGWDTAYDTYDPDAATDPWSDVPSDAALDFDIPTPRETMGCGCSVVS